jgi:hypothetical protein
MGLRQRFDFLTGHGNGSSCGWPNAAESIGVFYRNMNGLSCWEAVGQAREMFTEIAAEVIVYLENNSVEVPHKIVWSMYMVGKTKETARPVFMLCSTSCMEAGCQSQCRKKVRKTIEESEIIKKYQGVRIGDCSQPPDLGKVVDLVDAKEFLSQGDTKTLASCSILRYFNSSVCGSQIRITSGTNYNEFRSATAGGILLSGSRFFYLTAGHVFSVPDTVASKPMRPESDDDDIEFDIEGEMDRLGGEGVSVDLTSRGSLTPEPMDSDSSDDSTYVVEGITDMAFQPQIRIVPEVEEGRSSFLGSSIPPSDTTNDYQKPLKSKPTLLEFVGKLFTTSTDLDYALIEITNLNLRTFNQVPLDLNTLLYPENVATSLPQNCNVLAITGSTGAIKGFISRTPSYAVLPGSKKSQELWTIQLQGKLAIGDSGSWVIDAETGGLLGHIISGNPQTGAAYVVPAHNVLEHVHQRFSLWLDLATKRNVEMRQPLSFSKKNSSQDLLESHDTLSQSQSLTARHKNLGQAQSALQSHNKPFGVDNISKLDTAHNLRNNSQSQHLVITTNTIRTMRASRPKVKTGCTNCK